MTFSILPLFARDPRWTLGLTTCALLLAVPWILASDQKVSGDLTSNRDPTVAHLADGTTVYAWTLGAGPEASSEILARRFDSAGFPLSEPFVVNALSTGSQVRPDIDGDGSGGFVVTWTESGGNSQVVRGRIFASDDTPVGGNIQISEKAMGGNTVRPEVAVHDDGSFVVVWESVGFDGSAVGVAGRLFDSAGMALGPELVLNEETAGNQNRPNLAMDGDGGFLVTWHDNGIRGRLFGSDGAPQSGDLQLANIANFFQHSDAAMTPDGRFAIAYILNPQQGIPTIQRFDASGVPLEGPIALSEDTSLWKEEPTIAAHSDGTFQVAWETLYLAAADDVFARTVLPDGTLEGPAEIKVNLLGNQPAVDPDVAVNGSGSAIYTWLRDDFQDRIYTNCEGLGPCSVFSDGFEIRRRDVLERGLASVGKD